MSSIEPLGVDATEDQMRAFVREAIEKNQFYNSFRDLVKELCEYDESFGYDKFIVWLDTKTRHLKTTQRTALIRWSEAATKKLPHDALHFVTAIDATIVSEDVTLGQALGTSKTKKFVVLVNEAGLEQGVLTYKKLRDLRTDLMAKQTHIDIETLTIADLIRMNMLKLDFNFLTVHWNEHEKTIWDLLEKKEFVLVEDEKRKVVKVIVQPPEIRPASPARYVMSYVSSRIPAEVADLQIHFLEKLGNGLPSDASVLDVGTGPGTFAIRLACYARESMGGEKECIDITAVDRVHETEFKKALIEDKRKNKLQRLRIDFRGVDNLTCYGRDFDLVAWNLAFPTKEALETTPLILKSGGFLSVSYYDVTTLDNIIEILNAAFNKELRNVRHPNEIVTLPKLEQMVQRPGIEIRLRHSAPFPAKFDNAESFLHFIYCALPFVSGALSSFDEYPQLKERVWQSTMIEIEKNYGSANIETEFFVNFVVGRKKSD